MKRIPLVVTGNDGQVYMDDVPDYGGGQGNNETEEGNNDVPANQVGRDLMDRPVREQLLAVHSSICSLRRAQLEVRELLDQHRAERNRLFHIVNSNIRRISMVPTRRANPAQNVVNNNPVPQDNPEAPRAILKSRPRDLYELWTEYLTGLDGNKPARLFSARERGQMKYKYTRRKIFWDLVREITRTGVSSHVAIDRIYTVYGHSTSVTSIINGLRRDRNTNRLPVSLRN